MKGVAETSGRHDGLRVITIIEWYTEDMTCGELMESDDT
jgi:hypothetical protein